MLQHTNLLDVFDNNKCFFQDRTSKAFISQACVHHGLYVINSDNCNDVVPCVKHSHFVVSSVNNLTINIHSIVDTLTLFHSRIGHISMSKVVAY